MSFSTASANRAFRQIAIPVAISLLVAALMIALLLVLSTTRADTVSFARQEQLVSHVLDQSAAKLAREQESLIFKDNAVRLLTRPITDASDIERIHNNVGPLLHRYHGHDESYLLAGDDAPLYAMRDGRAVEPRAFEGIRRAAAPLTAELRAATRRIPRGSPLDGSPGIHDITLVNGHPAILSVKAVISPTGRVPQPPGREVLQISVLRLDGAFLRNLSRDYLFRAARFSWSDDRSADEASRAFVSLRSGRRVGYFIWRPDAPGSVVLRSMVPALILALLLIATVVCFLLRRIYRSTAELNASEVQARHLAFHDALTGLPNRALFNDRLDHALAAARRYQDRKVALLCLDLDRFKQVNDTLGHPAGDELIRELSRRLCHIVRDTDTVARLGGDEFAIVLTDVRSKRDISQLCARILESANAPFDLVGSQAFVGISIGVARSEVDGFDRTELTRKADIALYHAKNGGRGRYAIFARAMDASVQTRRSIEQELRSALDSGDQLELCYQPQFDTVSKSINGVEALVRWNHPERGVLYPATFIPVAEETGLIEPLGEWVLGEAARASANWPVRTVSVNVSAVQLRNPHFVQRVRKILRAAGMAPGRLELDITEAAFIDCGDQCRANLKELRALGVRIALDDFGTGYSSLTHLRDLAVDRLKIDRSFTASIPDADGGGAIVRAIIDLANATGLDVTAEGVETDEQSAFLTAAGCKDVQGFLLSGPLAPDEVDALLGVDSSWRSRRAARPLAA